MLSNEEIENKIYSFHKYMRNQTEDEIMQEYWEDIKQYIDQLESDKQNLIEKLEGANKLDKQTVQAYENMYRNATEEFYKRSYKRTIDMANARREVRKGILSILKGEKLWN